MMGLLVAPVEWVGGKVVINQLSKVASTEAAKSGIKSLLKSIGAQAATNFTTEAATEALNIVSELAVMQDKSQAVQYYNNYLQKHPGSESMALVDTMMQQLARIGQAGLAGAVAGGMMGAAATVWHRAQIEQMGRAAQADAQAIVQEGLSYGEGTQAYQQATEINQQMKEGEQPGDIQLGGLVETNAATDLDQQQITSALESRDGQPVDNAGQAGYAGNKVEGEGIDHDTHTDSGGAEAPAEPTALQLEGVQQSESAEAGQSAGAEGDFSHQGVEDAAEGAGEEIRYFKDEQLKTEPNKAYFWSGNSNGIGGKDFAMNHAANNEGTTLEGLMKNQGINMPIWDISDANSMKAWEDASATYARQVSGEVRALIGSSLRPNNVWQTVELPRLIDNTNVTKITIIDPETLTEKVIFWRKS